MSRMRLDRARQREGESISSGALAPVAEVGNDAERMKVLIVEDEAPIGRAIVQGLVEEGHQADLVTRGMDAQRQAELIGYDAIVLDWTLPDIDGLSVLRELRSRGLHVPILMLTARGTTQERVLGLRSGADDYLVKPFDFSELLARLEALYRRSAGALDSSSFGGVELDVRRRVLRCGVEEATLTPREYALGKELFARAGDVLSRSHLLRSVWGDDFVGDPNVVDVYVGYLRKKLTRIGSAGVHIDAVRGVGFRLVDDRPSGERPSGERSGSERSGGERPSGERPGGERPGSEPRSTER